ncbi:MAG: hypothetical protein EXS68_02770 [Candidatus Ryanbacteria bacterium]|nr:hypothetical protein [Candidatus Ryanbacteria bacterium]
MIVLLENLKTIPLKYPLWVYGEPKEVIPAFKFGKREFPESINPRRVRNDITGLIDAGIVQHLLEVKAISRRHVKKEHPNYGWAVGPDLKAYEDFYQKKRALEDLKDKRAYAEQKDEESFDALIEGREELIKSMKP